MQVSILLVFYNHEKYIKECVDSIIMQEMPFDYEIIVCDDYSTDLTLSIIESSFKQAGIENRILNRDSNVGLVKNYQKGFAACQGDYIVIVEGDDYWTDKKRIVKLVSFMQSHKECAMVFNSTIIYNEEDGQFSYPDNTKTNDFEYIPTNDLAAGKKYVGNLSACVFRNSVIKKLKPDLFDLPIADWMISMVVGQFGLIAHFHEPTSVYRRHPNGLWTQMTKKKKLRKLIYLVDVYNKYLEYKYNEEFSAYRRRLTIQLYLSNKLISYIYNIPKTGIPIVKKIFS